MVTTQIALLRAINVGGHNKISMATLRELCTALGWERPRTLLQSGNLIYRTAEEDGETLSQRLEASILERCGFRCKVVHLNPNRLRRAMAQSPFTPDKGSLPNQTLFMFLETEPEEEGRTALLAANKGPEEIAFGDRILYLHYPEGIGRSKLTNVLIEKKLGVRGTARNWNTLRKIMDLACMED